MFQYLSSYRAYILTKAGLSIAYLWFCWDFIRLNLALHQHLQELIPALATETVCTDPDINKALISILSFLGHLHACWIYLYLSPIAILPIFIERLYFLVKRLLAHRCVQSDCTAGC